MSKDFQIVKLLSYYFPNEDQDFTDKMERFFKEVKFKNPRHLKKVLNKYTAIREFKKENPDNEFSKLVPNTKINGDGYFLNTIFVLYIIILFEFYHEKFEEIKNYEDKFENYIEYLVSNDINRKWIVTIKTDIVNSAFKKGEYKNLTKFAEMRSSISGESDAENIPDFMFKFLNIFTPKINREFSFKGLPGNTYKIQYIIDYLNQFESKDNSFPISFCKYLLRNRKILKEKIDIDEWVKSCGDYDIFDLFKMAETIL